MRKRKAIFAVYMAGVIGAAVGAAIAAVTDETAVEEATPEAVSPKVIEPDKIGGILFQCNQVMDFTFNKKLGVWVVTCKTPTKE